MHSERSVLVLELGSKYVKCGLSEERASRCVLKWEVAELLQNPMGAQQWYAYLYPKLHDICFNLLHANPAHRRFLICEDMLFPTVFREVVAKIIFSVMKASSVAMVPSMLMAMYATCNHTALVVDCGWAETRILPVYKGIPLVHLYRFDHFYFPIAATRMASKSCCERIVHELSNVPLFSMSNAEDVLERACFVRPMINAALRSSVVESLFKGDHTDVSITIAILETIKKAPIDVRTALLESILLVGGTSMIPGFVTRLVDELMEEIQKESDKQTVRIVPTYFPRNMLPWIGGSVYAATESMRNVSVSSAQYSSGDFQLSDWLSIAENEF
ncbi:TPA: hypothetical protein N0F65_004307 [Lagenidium giganteum]|uniref:Actin-related protein 10 n=1 Tax=Lagenidium giganteum TaxID=4803 RepID=A0AAV2ZH16_9STRA|nr:TPA: hypothetical protein N0F65_004307 [Lagenidium giganteum]